MIACTSLLLRVSPTPTSVIRSANLEPSPSPVESSQALCMTLEKLTPPLEVVEDDEIAMTLAPSTIISQPRPTPRWTPASRPACKNPCSRSKMSCRAASSDHARLTRSRSYNPTESPVAIRRYRVVESAMGREEVRDLRRAARRDRGAIRSGVSLVSSSFSSSDRVKSHRLQPVVSTG